MKQKIAYGIIALFLAIALLIAGCKPLEEKPVSQHGAAVDYVSLLGNLRAKGATVEPGEEIEQSFFSVKGNVIKVNGNDVQVFEYANENEANEESSQISEDGTSIGTTMVTWIDSPHFYKKGRLIALYVGSDDTAMDALESALGEQFAGARAEKEIEISDFENCAKAGYPILESYPRQCKTPDGKTFIEEIENAVEKTIETGKGQLKLSYRDSKAILSGTLERSTPCVKWDVEIGGTKDLPRTQVTIDIFNSNKEAICIQILGEPQEIYKEIENVSEETSYTVKLEQDNVFSSKLK